MQSLRQVSLHGFLKKLMTRAKINFIFYELTFLFQNVLIYKGEKWNRGPSESEGFVNCLTGVILIVVVFLIYPVNDGENKSCINKSDFFHMFLNLNSLMFPI